MAEILYTSGTTGKPKGCLHNHHTVFQQAMACAASLGIANDTRMLVAMPIWHASPLNNWTLGTLAVGGTVVLLREYQPQAFIEVIEAEKITMTFAAPVALLAPLHGVPDLRTRDLSSMRRWIYGGGPLGRDMALRLIEAGLGWGWLPQSFVRSQVAAGSLVVLPFENLTNGLALWVDVVWSKERPLGLGARRFIELIQDVRGER